MLHVLLSGRGSLTQHSVSPLPKPYHHLYNNPTKGLPAILALNHCSVLKVSRACSRAGRIRFRIIVIGNSSKQSKAGHSMLLYSERLRYVGSAARSSAVYVTERPRVARRVGNPHHHAV